VSLIPVVVVAVASRAASAIAPAAPSVLGDSILLVELLENPTIISIVGVTLVEDVVAASSSLNTLGVVLTMVLLVRLCREDISLLALAVLRLGLRERRLRKIVQEEPPLLGLGAPIGDLKEPDHGGQLFIPRQLFLHLDVGDAHEERGDDLLVGDPRNLVPLLAETLDVLSKRLTLVLTHRLEVILHGGALVRRHEIGDELPAPILPRGNGLVRKVHEPSSRRILEGHVELVVHDALISTHILYNDDVELDELDGVGGPIVTRADVRPKLVRPDHTALLASESEAPGVVDKLPRNLDVLARIANVVDGAVMIFSMTPKGDANIF
jgi:hypothetical protein